MALDLAALATHLHVIPSSRNMIIGMPPRAVHESCHQHRGYPCSHGTQERPSPELIVRVSGSASGSSVSKRPDEKQRSHAK